MKRKQPEFKLHCVVADHLRKHYPHLLWFHPANGEARTERSGARLKRMGVLAGTPDIIMFWREDNRPRMAAIELKYGAGKMTDTQISFMERWTAIGGLFAECRSLDDVHDFLTAWRVPMFEQCPTRYAENSITPQYVRPRKKQKLD